MYEKLGVQSFHTKLSWVDPFFERFDSVELIEVRSTEGILGGGLDKNLGDFAGAWVDLMIRDYSEGLHLGCADHVVVVLKKFVEPGPDRQFLQ